MSDADLLKRLAEREGWELRPIGPKGELCYRGVWRVEDLPGDVAFALIEKYQIEIDLARKTWGDKEPLWCCFTWHREPDGMHSRVSEDTDLKRAICLAVDAMEGEQ